MKKATLQHTKKHNTRLILKMIYDHELISRADIARKTGLTRPTVSTIVANLIHDGLVIESGTAPSTGGKPPILLCLVDNAYHTICIDVGNTQITGAILDLQGEIVYQTTRILAEESKETIEVLHDVIDELLAKNEAPILGLALGVPGFINTKEGYVRQSVNLNWNNLPLKKSLEQKYDLSVYLANDSQAAALGEFTRGILPKGDHLIFLKIGKGIGAGIILHKEIFFGDGFGAGEIGHVVVDKQDGQLRTLESIGNRNHILQLITSQDPSITSWEDVEAQRDENLVIKQVTQQVSQYYGVAVANLIASYNIHNIVFSGKINSLGAPFLNCVKAVANQYCLPEMVKDTNLEWATISDNAVLYGCWALILKEELGIL